MNIEVLNKLKIRKYDFSGVVILLLGFLWVGGLYLVSSGFSAGDETRSPTDSVAVVNSEAQYQALADYETSPLPVSDLLVEDVDGSVLAATSTDVLPSSGNPVYEYAPQMSCNLEQQNRTACSGPDDDYPDGICINDQVEITLVEIYAPEAFLLGINEANLDSDRLVYEETESAAPCSDKATGEYIKGSLCYSALGSGGSPYQSGERSLRSYSPGIYADKKAALLGLEGTEFDQIGNYELENPETDSKDQGQFVQFGESDEYPNSNPNSAVSSNKRENQEINVGYGLRNPIALTDSYAEGKDECAVPEIDFTGAPHLENGDGAVKVDGLVSNTGPATIDLGSIINTSWLKCTLFPASPDCKYRVVQAIRVESLFGSPYKCIPGQCTQYSANAYVSGTSSPLDLNLIVAGVDPEPGKATYKQNYVTTNCVVDLKDRSKLGSPTYKDVNAKCAWAVPQLAKNRLQSGESTPGTFPSDEEYLRIGVQEVNIYR